MKNVKEISGDYIIPGETAPHAIMFVRSESVYDQFKIVKMI